MARLPWLIRTRCFWVLTEFFRKLKKVNIFGNFLILSCSYILCVLIRPASLESPHHRGDLMSILNILCRKSKNVSLNYRCMLPNMAPWITFSGSNYPCLEHFSMVPKMFKPLTFDCTVLEGGGWGGRVLGGELWYECASQYFAFEKTDPFIYLIVRNVDLFIFCPLIFYAHLLLVVRQIWQSIHWIPREQTASKHLWAKNIRTCREVRKVGPFTYESRKVNFNQTSQACCLCGSLPK